MKNFSLLCLCLVPLPLACGEPKDPRPSRTVTNSIGMKFVRIPAGTFLMGSPDTDPAAREDEKPQHKVRITKPFYLGAFEVTQGEFERILGRRSSFFSPTGAGAEKVKGLDSARFPAEQVRWYDAVAFCRKLSALPEEKKAGRVYRLPTEAEWEYACRAGTTTAFAFGDSLSSTQANFDGHFPHGGGKKGPFLARTTQVGSYEPNPWGLYDTHGNVWEWCADWYGREYYKESPLDDPTGPRRGSVRVIRGGEWYGDARDCRSAFRYADLPGGVFYVMGFRVLLTTAPSAKPGAPTTTGIDEPTLTKVKPAPPVAVAPARPGSGEDWPRWRGPRGNGTWRGPKIPDKWPEGGLTRLWQQPIGGGYAGVAATGGKVFTLDYHQEPGEVERVLCFEADTGKQLWAHPYPVRYEGLSYPTGPRATPTVHDGRVSTLGAVGHLHCLDVATGKVLWAKDLVREEKARVPLWGFAAAPLVFEDLLIVHAGAEPDGCLLALDRRSGKEVWRNLPDPAGYAAPILITSQGRHHLVCWTPENVVGLDPRTGKLLWSVPFRVTYGTSIATPIFEDGIVLVSGYYVGSKAIRLGPAATRAEEAWADRRNLRGLMAQPLYRHGHVYLLDKRHGLTCFELKTGRKRWDDGNRSTPKGRNPQMTMVWAGSGDRALLLNSVGELILARLNPAGYHELARARILGPTWAHPAYARGRVYARSDSELVCVSLP